MSIDAKRVMNGKYGEIWLDGDYVAEIFKCQAKIDFKKEPVPMCGDNKGEDNKVVGWSGKGSLGMNKVNSRMAQKLRQLTKEGKDVRFTVISKLADPDSLGTERAVLKNVSFDDLTIADWESGKNGQIEAPFTFNDYDPLDEVTPQ